MKKRIYNRNLIKMAYSQSIALNKQSNELNVFAFHTLRSTIIFRTLESNSSRPTVSTPLPADDCGGLAVNKT